MTWKWTIPTLVVLAAGALAFGITRHAVCGRSGSSVDGLQDISFLTRELKLTADQAKAVKALHVTLGTRLEDCCARHCAARARIGEALRNETNGAAQARAIVAEMGRAYEESEMATLEHIEQVRAILTPEQRRHFDGLIGDCLCRDCPMPGGATMGGAKGQIRH